MTFWEAVYDAIPFPSYVVDIETHQLLSINSAMRERLAGDARQPCHKALFALDEPCPFCPIRDVVTQWETDGTGITFERFNEFDDRWYQHRESLVRWSDGRMAKYCLAVDITSLKKVQNELAEAHAELSLKNRQLEHVATTDPLTGLANRRRLDEALQNEVARARRFGHHLSVIMVDMDKFKSVNDTFGHQAGDRVLVELAGILRQQSRKIDTVGRWGGEEFLILCPGTDTPGALLKAEHMRAAIANWTFTTVGTKTSSFGVATLGATESGHDAVGRADAALYRAKEGGRNRVEGSPLGL